MANWNLGFAGLVLTVSILYIWRHTNENGHETVTRTIIESDHGTTHISDEKVQETVTKTIIGIDLGTTYSSVGVYKNGRVEIIADDENNRIIPSCVAFTAHGERLIGVDAQRQLTSNPENTVFDAKRLIGRKFNDPGVQSDMKYFPFNVIEKNNKPYIEVTVNGNKTIFAPEEISAMVLHKLKEMAEAHLGEAVTHAVITVPSSFNHVQRQATKDAGTIAGLNVERLIVEPTAAALRYGFGKNVNKTILVFNLGGSTIDVSVLQIENEVFQVHATNGNTRLGGQDFNQNVMNHLINRHMDTTGEDVWRHKIALQKLMREVEKAKRTISSKSDAFLEIENFVNNEDYNETLKRGLFERINRRFFTSLNNTVMRALDDADHTVEDIDEIVLVGGSTRIPMVRNRVANMFKKAKIFPNNNTEEDIAYGAAVQAGVLGLMKHTENVVLFDVYPNSLGLWIRDGVKEEMIARNTALPQRNSHVFKVCGNVTSFVMYEGILVNDSYDLDKFNLSEILQTQDCVEIKITFSMDVSGILSVSAINQNTGEKKSNIITFDDKRLSEHDIERMIQKAKTFAVHDQKIKERNIAKNRLEEYAYKLKNAAEKTISWLDDHQEGAKDNEYHEKRKSLEEINL